MGIDWLVKRPLAVISGAFVAGALAEAGVPEISAVLFAAVALAVFSFLFAISFPSHRLFWATICTFALGFGLTRYRLPPVPPDLQPPFNAVVTSAPALTKDGYRLLLHANDAFVQISVRTDELPSWQIGDLLRVEKFWGRATSWRRMRFQISCSQAIQLILLSSSRPTLC